MHLIGSQFPRDDAHLFVDVVLARALRERCQLALDVSRVLTSQRRRPRFLSTGAMTRGARRNAPFGISDIDQTDSRIALTQAVPAEAVCGRPPGRWAKYTATSADARSFRLVAIALMTPQSRFCER